MKRLKIVLILWCIIRTSSGFLTPEADFNRDGMMQSASYPRPGDIPILNRKIFRGQRVSIREHPYVASIRRMCSHYLTGVIVTRSIILSVAHPLVNVPTKELNVILGENYNDRGSTLLTVILYVIHQDFDPYTLRNDIAMIRLYETVSYTSSIKAIVLTSPMSMRPLGGKTAFVTGWGRCDNMGTELCLDRSSLYYPDEKMDPMLRTVSFSISSNNYYCEGYKRHEVSIRAGMLCAGVAREEDQVTPCLGVPGALLVVDARLVGILSWGFGCGYSYDLPLVYTDIRHFLPWITHNNRVMFQIKQANLSVLFQATKAAVLSQWLDETRNVTRKVNIRTDRNLEPLTLDALLIQLGGTTFDVRDFIENGHYSEEKATMYAALRSELNKAESSAAKKDKLRLQFVPRRLKPFLGKLAKQDAGLK